LYGPFPHGALIKSKNLVSIQRPRPAPANREQELSDAEFQQKLRLQEHAARDAQAREMARINRQTATAAQTDQAEAAARYAAYQSGDPVSAAAAAVTAGDIDWISALSAAGNVIF
jgi:hypothetical protein